MADSTLSLTIGGIEYGDYVHIPGISITDSLPANGDSLSFELRIPANCIMSDGPYKPLCLQIAVLTINGVKEFAGPLTAIKETPLVAADVFTYQCQCSDFTPLLDKRLVIKKDLNAASAGDMIRLIVSEYAPEFTTNNVNHGSEIPEQQFDYVSVSSVLDSISQASGFNWYVDYDKDIHFFQTEDMSAPVIILDVDTDPLVGGVNIDEDISRIKNVIFLKDYTAKKAEAEKDVFVSEENKSFYKLPNAIFDFDDMIVKDSDVSRTVIDDASTDENTDVQGSAGSVYACILNMGIRFPLNDLPGGGAAGVPIEVEYHAEVKEQAIPLEDPHSIRMMRSREKDPFDGRHEKTISLSEMRVPDLATIIGWGEIILDRLAWPILKGEFETLNYTGWKAGQSFILQSNRRDLIDTKSYWVLGIKRSPKVYVQSVSKQILPSINEVGEHIFRTRSKVSFSNITSEMAI